MLEEIVSDSVIDQAYQWLCKRRKDYTHNNNVWHLRFRWIQIKPQLQADLHAGHYRFHPLQRYQFGGEYIEVWAAMDVLVLKTIAIVLGKRVNLPQCCTHLKGNGSAKAEVRGVVENLPGHPFVFRSDVKGYYASINHEILMDQLRGKIQDRIVLNLKCRC